MFTLKSMRFDTTVLKSVKNKSKRKKNWLFQLARKNIVLCIHNKIVNIPSCGVLSRDFKPSKSSAT